MPRDAETLPLTQDQVAMALGSADGVVPRAVYNAFEDVASLSRASGRVSARRDGRLDFSDGIPEGVQQQFQNAWWSGRDA